MPTRTAAPVRERDYDYTNVGKVGRRTGVTLAPRSLDEHGLEDVSGMFSSPRKSSPAKRGGIIQSVEEVIEQTPRNGSAQPRTPGTSTSLRRSNRGASHPLPRSASPKKTGISGTARRSGPVDLLAQQQLQQEAQDTYEEELEDPTTNDTQVSITPAQSLRAKAVSARPATTTRRFSPDRTPLRNRVLNRQTKSAYVGRVSDAQSMLQNEMGELDDQETPSHLHINHAAPEEEMHHRPDNVEILADDAEDKEPALPESEDDDLDPELLPPPPPLDDEDEDQTFEPESRQSNKRSQKNTANSRRKRRSDALEDAESAIALSSPAAKRAKRRSDEGIQPQRNPATSELPKGPRGRKPLASKSANPKLSIQRQKELDDVVEKIRARPGPAKSLYILRRETPADDAIGRTRSGRISIKPLAWWRNEGIVYGGSPSGQSAGRGLKDGARFPLDSIKEIVRTEEHIQSNPSRGRPKKSTKGKGKAQRQHDEDSDLDLKGDEQAIDPDADDWELDTGTIRGPVAIWDPEQKGPDHEEEELEIAHAAAAIQTKQIPGSTFRYAKLLSTRFFGTGLVDLPPGGLKKPKSSRKMHMSFFVAQGRVTVGVGPSSGHLTKFSIGKGGFWQVPRGNMYWIENEHGKTARIFFSQACEPAPTDFDE